MSRGRPRHQSSRRRMYSGRQRELRERRTQAVIDGQGAPDRGAVIEIDDARDYESPAWSVPLRGRASAA